MMGTVTKHRIHTTALRGSWPWITGVLGTIGLISALVLWVDYASRPQRIQSVVHAEINHAEWLTPARVTASHSDDAFMDFAIGATFSLPAEQADWYAHNPPFKKCSQQPAQCDHTANVSDTAISSWQLNDEPANISQTMTVDTRKSTVQLDYAAY